MRGMPSVVTFSTWVSPRWKSAEPCAVGSRSISAESGRMSAVPRPSTRTPSSTMRLRTSFLVSERMARLDLARPVGELVAEGGADLLAGGVERGVALGLARDQVGLGDGVGADRLHPGPHVVLVVGEGRERDGLDRTPRRRVGLDQAALQVDGLADPRLGRLEAGGQHLFGDLRGAGVVVGPRLLGPARLDHHDGDLAVGVLGQRPAGHDELEGRLLALLEGRVRDPRRPRSCRRRGRRRWGRRRGCPRASAPPTTR